MPARRTTTRKSTPTARTSKRAAKPAKVAKPAKKTVRSSSGKKASSKRAAPPSPTIRPAKAGITVRRTTPTPSFPIPSSEVPVVVARSSITEGRIEVRVEAPKRIEIPLGSLLLVRHAYQLLESSSDKETWQFRLDARLGDHVKEPVIERIVDRMGVTDDMTGFVQQRFRPDRAGTYRLDFSASAECQVQAWGSRKVRQHERRDGEGRVTVVVG